MYWHRHDRHSGDGLGCKTPHLTADEIKGTFKNYNLSDENNEKPNSVIGIYYDRHFELITSMEVFYKLYDILDAEYEKYYNNLYE